MELTEIALFLEKNFVAFPIFVSLWFMLRLEKKMERIAQAIEQRPLCPYQDKLKKFVK